MSKLSSKKPKTHTLKKTKNTHSQKKPKTHTRKKPKTHTRKKTKNLPLYVSKSTSVLLSLYTETHCSHLSQHTYPPPLFCETQKMVYSFIGDIDTTKVVFLPFQQKDGRSMVEICKDKSSTTKNKLVFNLCPDVDSKFPTRYRLDSVRDDQDGSRRGLTVSIGDTSAVKQLTMLDDHLVATAVANSKEWFKKTLTEIEVRARYKPIVFFAQEDDSVPSCKFKVKCTKYPTKLHLSEGDMIYENGGKLEHLNKGASVAPILSIYSVWFMGGGSSFGISMQAEEMVISAGDESTPLANFNVKRALQVVTTDEGCDEKRAKLTTGEVTLEEEN